MEFFRFFFSAPNIPFLLMLGMALLFALLQVFAGGDADGDADVDADMDADVDVDVDADASAAATSGGVGAGILAALGVGRVPLMVILMVFSAAFGLTGLVGNATVLTISGGSYPELAILPVLGISIVFAFVVTNQVGRVIARLVPKSGAATQREQLVGRVGVVVSHVVNQNYGRVQVRDTQGTMHTVYAVIQEGEPLPDRSEVAILAYDADRRHYVVRSMEQRRV